MRTSDEINELAAALAKAQGVIANPDKGKVNPHFKSRYADIADGLEVIRPALSAQGLAFVQTTEVDRNADVLLTTRLIHASGQWIESDYPVGRAGDHQKLGASLTYAKRQSLFALVGVAGALDDDDGNEASKGAPAPANVAYVSDAQIKELCDLVAEVGADRARLLEHLKIDGLAEIPAKDFDFVRALIEKKRKAAA